MTNFGQVPARGQVTTITILYTSQTNMIRSACKVVHMACDALGIRGHEVSDLESNVTTPA